jgi:hypothetical protein
LDETDVGHLLHQYQRRTGLSIEGKRYLNLENFFLQVLCDLIELSKTCLGDSDILKELEVASNLTELQAPPSTRDTNMTYRDVHSRPSQLEMYSNLRGGPGQNMFGVSPRKPNYNNSRGSPARYVFSYRFLFTTTKIMSAKLNFT